MSCLKTDSITLKDNYMKTVLTAKVPAQKFLFSSVIFLGTDKTHRSWIAFAAESTAIVPSDSPLL